MNKFLRVVFVDHLGKKNFPLGNNITMLATAAGHHQFTRLFAAFYSMENNILLQYAIVAERCAA